MNFEKMKLSVALCTYNGEQFIEEQISSILNQTCHVNEIVVCDDCSTDGTVAIIKRIAECNVDTKIRTIINEKKLGVCANFEKAVYECSGDIIFLSDQDDVWYPHKVKTIVDWFEKNPDKSAVFTDADLVDSNGKQLYKDKTLWSYVGFYRKIQEQFDAGYSFEIVANRYRCTGATMALKRDFVFHFSSCCKNGVYHDAIIALVASLHNKLGYVATKLIKYRIHGNQNAGLNMEEAPITDKYQTHSINKEMLDCKMTTKERKHLELFILRSDIPKKAVLKLGSYLYVYGIAGLSFWWHDVMKLCKV